MKNAKLALETLRLLKFPTNKVKLVLNRSNAYTWINVRNAESALNRKVDFELINEYRGAIIQRAGPRVADAALDVVERRQRDPRATRQV